MFSDAAVLRHARSGLGDHRQEFNVLDSIVVGSNPEVAANRLSKRGEVRALYSPPGPLSIKLFI